jgi:RNA polymerase sigma factor (sigma-70 family)
VADAFETFVVTNEPRLRRALVAAYGPEAGREATAAALAWAWEHWEQVQAMTNPVGYLYRVGQSSGRERKQPTLMPEESPELSRFEPALESALAALSEQQRVSVLLVEGYGLTQQETADLLGISVSSVRVHLRRAMERLRVALGEVVDDGR